jgi:hypothetical protein
MLMYFISGYSKNFLAGVFGVTHDYYSLALYLPVNDNRPTGMLQGWLFQ